MESEEKNQICGFLGFCLANHIFDKQMPRPLRLNYICLGYLHNARYDVVR